MESIKNHEAGAEKLRDYVCGVDGCNHDLTIAWGGAFGVESLVIRCGNDPNHEGYKPRTTALQAIRRTAGTGIENIPMDPQAARRQIGLLSIRYPAVLDNEASAALFLLECKRLSLDPLMSPAEAIPVAFNDKKTGKKVIAMIISTDGWLSMAARSEPGRWIGPPSCKLVTGDLKAVIADDNAKTVVVEAIGSIRDQESRLPIASSSAYGFYRSTESSQVEKGNSPWNMACKRAIKRWVRENFPACRTKMAEQTSGWMASSTGVKVAEDAIEADFVVLSGSVQDNEPDWDAIKAAEDATRKAIVAPITKVQDSKLKPRADWDKVKEADVKDYLALEKVAFQLAGIQPVDLYKKLGGGSRSSMTTKAWDAFLTIKDEIYPQA